MIILSSSKFFLQGSKIIANRQPSVELNQTRANLSQERNLEVRGGNLIEIDPKKQKKFTFFKFKKSQTRAKSETREINRPGGFTFFGRSSSIKKLPEHTSDYSPPDINLPFIQNAANTPNTLTNTANITLDINTGKKVTETQIQSPLYNNQAEKVHKSASNTLGPNNDSNVFKLHTPDVYTRTLHNRLNTDHSVEQSPEQTFKNRLNISNVNQNQSEIYPKITINSYANDNNMSKIDYNVTLDTFSGMSGKNEEFVRPSRQSNFYNSREALRNMHRRDNFVSEPTETTIEPWDNKQNNQPNALFKTSFNSRNQNSNMWNQYNAPVGDDFYNITNRNNYQMIIWHRHKIICKAIIILNKEVYNIIFYNKTHKKIFNNRTYNKICNNKTYNKMFNIKFYNKIFNNKNFHKITTSKNLRTINIYTTIMDDHTLITIKCLN